MYLISRATTNIIKTCIVWKVEEKKNGIIYILVNPKENWKGEIKKQWQSNNSKNKGQIETKSKYKTKFNYINAAAAASTAKLLRSCLTIPIPILNINGLKIQIKKRVFSDCFFFFLKRQLYAMYKKPTLNTKHRNTWNKRTEKKP